MNNDIMFEELQETLEEFKCSMNILTENVKDMFAIGFISQIESLYKNDPTDSRINDLIKSLNELFV